jgi:DNA-directed RNA polymerase specialized sigma subunit
MSSTNDAPPKNMADLTKFPPPVPLADEASFAERAQAGDEEAFNALVMGSFHEAIPYLYRISRNRLPEDMMVSLAYQALQKAAKTYDAQHRLRFFGHAKQYLRGEVSAWWTFQDVVRGSSTQMEEFPEDCAATTLSEICYDEDGAGTSKLLEEKCFAAPCFQEVFIHTATADTLALLRKHLPEHYVTVLVMYYCEGKTFKQIGKLFDGKTRAWAGLIHQLALAKIKKLRAVKAFTGGERVLD